MASSGYSGINLSFPIWDVADKAKVVNHHCNEMLDRTLRMFHYEGLPDTITRRSAEIYMQTGGFVGLFQYDGNWYPGTGGLGGEPDPEYMPTIFTVANPALDYSANLDIGKDCVIIPNDSMYQGLSPMFSRYGTAICENEITMHLQDVLARLTAFIDADNDNDMKSAQKVIDDLLEGKLHVAGKSAVLDGVRVQPLATASGSNRFTDCIELQQYLKASWFNEIGLSANYNMKREAINSQEAQIGHDSLIPLVDDMLQCRKEGWQQFNEMSGMNVSVELSDVWKQKQDDTGEENPEDKPEESEDQEDGEQTDEDH